MTDAEIKATKIKIMNELLDVYGTNLKVIFTNSNVNEADVADILMSCLIMQVRDVLVKMVFGMGKEEFKDEVVNIFLDSVKEAIDNSFEHHSKMNMKVPGLFEKLH